MIEAYGYLRVSGRGQVDGDGFPRQRAAIEKHAAAVGLAIAGWYEERAVKGATEWEYRPAWLDMLQNLNGCRTIIIERLDRLARDLMVQEHIIADLAKRRITLVSVAEPDLGSTDPSRVLMRQIMGAIAQYDKAMIVLKLRGARQRAAARDGRCEGQKPYGYYPGEAAGLADIQRMAALGMSPAGIARALTVAPRTGMRWHPHSVARIAARAKEAGK